jgi:hypothetical protein
MIPAPIWDRSFAPSDQLEKVKMKEMPQPTAASKRENLGIRLFLRKFMFIFLFSNGPAKAV